MLESDQQRDTRADAAAAKDGRRAALLPADAEHVILHIGKRERRLDLVRTAVAADVDADAAKVRGEVLDLVQPEPVIERIGVHEDEVWSFARDFVINPRPGY